MRGRAGFLELETNQSQARAAATPGPLPSVCVISLIQQNTCPAVATLQAAEELWGAPGLAPGCPQARDGRAEGWGSGGAHGPPSLPAHTLPSTALALGPPARHLANEELLLSTPWNEKLSIPTFNVPFQNSVHDIASEPHEGLLYAWAGRQFFREEAESQRGARSCPGPSCWL